MNIRINIKTFAFGYRGVFLLEQRTELYEQYCSGVAHRKIRLSAKNSRGVPSSARQQARMLRMF